MAGQQNSSGSTRTEPPCDPFYDQFHGLTSRDWTWIMYTGFHERLIRRFRLAGPELNAEDAATDVISRIGMRFHKVSYDPVLQGPFQAYALRCVRTAVVDWRRRRRLPVISGATEDFDLVAELPDDGSERDQQIAENNMDSVRSNQIDAIARRAVELFRQSASPTQLAIITRLHASDSPPAVLVLAESLSILRADVYALKYRAWKLWKDAMMLATREITGQDLGTERTEHTQAAVMSRMKHLWRSGPTPVREDV